MDVPLTDPQSAFVFSTKPHPAIVAGLGAGKSRAATMRLILLMLQDPGINTLYTMPTYDLLKLRAIPGVIDDLNMMGIKYTINKSDYAITIKGLGKIYFRSYDNPDRLIAFEVAHSVADELDVLTKQQAQLVWRKITERTRQRSKLPNSLAAVTTPDQGFSGFVYDRWVTRADASTELIKAATTSNPYLPPGYVEQIRANYDAALADMYINGEFVSLTANKVYHYFSRTTHDTDTVLEKGDSGSTGATGPQGLKGDTGPAGSAGANGISYTPQAPVARTVTPATAYQHTDVTKPYKVIVNARSTQTVTVAGLVSDKVELRIGATAASVAAGATGGLSIGLWESGITGIALMVGAAVLDGGQISADVPAGWYFSVNRLTGTNATIVSCFTQSLTP